MIDSNSQAINSDCLSIVKKIAFLVDAKHGWTVWRMHDKHHGDFTGEIFLADADGSYDDESVRVLRMFVTRQSFRIAWYADRVEGKLYQAFDAAHIVPLPGALPRGRSKLKNPLSVSATIPEAVISITPILQGLDAYDFCE
jgi:hypothetical protein